VQVAHTYKHIYGISNVKFAELSRKNINNKTITVSEARTLDGLGENIGT